jgi:predicted nucleic acid-binding Zn ribbon protein
MRDPNTKRFFIRFMAALALAAVGMLTAAGLGPAARPVMLLAAGVGAALGGWAAWDFARQRREDRYDLSRLWEREEPREDAEESDEPFDMVYCRRCGAAMPADRAFCQDCGNKLGY